MTQKLAALIAAGKRNSVDLMPIARVLVQIGLATASAYAIRQARAAMAIKTLASNAASLDYHAKLAIPATANANAS